MKTETRRWNMLNYANELEVQEKELHNGENEEQKKERTKPSRFFAAILYPEEDSKHEYLLGWITHQFESVYIRHEGEDLNLISKEDNDFKKEEDEVDFLENHNKHKPHIHIMFKVINPMRASAFTSKRGMFFPFLKHVKPINNADHYLLYMLHKRPIDHWFSQFGRIIYKEEDLKTNSLFWGTKIEQNRNFAQTDVYSMYGKFMEIVQDNPGISIIDVVQSGELPFWFICDNLMKCKYIVQDHRDSIKFTKEYVK